MEEQGVDRMANKASGKIFIILATLGRCLPTDVPALNTRTKFGFTGYKGGKIIQPDLIVLMEFFVPALIPLILEILISNIK